MAAAAPPPLRAAVVGAGHLGRHHARLYAASASARLVAVADILPGRAAEVASACGAEAVADFRSLIGRVDVASVAVPTAAHEEVACGLLEAGVAVLVEKPIASSLEAADRLVALARRTGLTLMVGHTERFNPAVEALAAHTRGPRFVEAHRLGSFSARSLDIDVVADLMIHDIDVLFALAGGGLVSVDAVGIGALTSRVDIASVRLRLASGCVANLTASRISEQKVRKLRVWESDSYYSLDYGEQEVRHWFLRRDGGETAIGSETLAVERDEPLRREIEQFLRAVRGEERPRVDGEAGRRALEAALLVAESIRRGAPVTGTA